MPVSDSIKVSVERKLRELMKKGATPSKEELQTLNIAVKYLSVLAKLSEDDWGKDLADLNEEGGKPDELDDDS
jgi:hypothetical protein